MTRFFRPKFWIPSTKQGPDASFASLTSSLHIHVHTCRLQLVVTIDGSGSISNSKRGLVMLCSRHQACVIFRHPAASEWRQPPGGWPADHRSYSGLTSTCLDRIGLHGGQCAVPVVVLDAVVFSSPAGHAIVPFSHSCPHPVNTKTQNFVKEFY